MPELGEVEFARHQFSLYGLNTEITNVVLSNDKGEFDSIVCECSEKELKNVLAKGNKITTSNRMGKQLYFEIVNGKKKVQSLLIHFGMTGSLVWKDKECPNYKSFSVDTEAWPPRFSKLHINFKNGNSVSFCDARRIGRIKLRNNPLLEEPLSRLAPGINTSIIVCTVFICPIEPFTIPSTYTNYSYHYYHIIIIIIIIIRSIN